MIDRKELEEPKELWYFYNRLTEDENVSGRELPDHIRYVRADTITALEEREREMREALEKAKSALRDTYGRVEYPATEDCAENIAYIAVCKALGATHD